MDYYEIKRINRFKRVIEILKENYSDIWFLKTETGKLIHISINETVICGNGAKLISHWSRDIEDFNLLCGDCVGNNRYRYITTCNLSYWEPNINPVSWRCKSIVNNKNNKKKLVRCRKTMEGPLDGFCTQHKMGILKYIRNYTNIPDDIINIIYNML